MYLTAKSVSLEVQDGIHWWTPNGLKKYLVQFCILIQRRPTGIHQNVCNFLKEIDIIIHR